MRRPSAFRLACAVVALVLSACDGGPGPGDLPDGGPTPLLDGAPRDDAHVAPIDGSAGDDATTGGRDSGPRRDAGPIVVDPRDVLRPRVTVEQGAAQSDPTSETSLVFDVTFDEMIDPTTLTASDFLVEPAGIPIGMELVDLGDRIAFELVLSDLPRADIRWEVSLPDLAALDLAGNPSEPSTSTDGRVLVDVAEPSVSVYAFPGGAGVPVTNTLPLRFQVQFDSRAVTGFDPTEVVNGGTAPGVTFAVTTVSDGYVYLVDATAAAGEGTIVPQIPAGAALDLMGRPTLESVLVGAPTTYTPRPILTIHEADVVEGEIPRVIVGFLGTRTGTTATTFDWSLEDDTALAGTHYAAGSGDDVSIASGASASLVLLPATPEDTTPEPLRRFTMHVSDVRGDVYVHDDAASIWVRDDDSGYYVFGGTDGDPDDGARELAIEGDYLYVYGDSSGPSLRRLARVSGMVLTSHSVGGFGGGTASGLAIHPLGPIVAYSRPTLGYSIDAYQPGATAVRGEFGDSGSVDVVDAERASTDLVADATHVFVVGTRESASGARSWFLERRDAITGALTPGFGTGGLLEIDAVAGSDRETPRALRLEGARLFVLLDVGAETRLEARRTTDGALDPTIGTGGVITFGAPFASVADVDVRAGTIYVVGREAGRTRVAALEPSGAERWAYPCVMDDPRAIHASAWGLFVGGARELDMHLEGWSIDGDPRWARSWFYGPGDSAVTAILYEEGSHWVHLVGQQGDAAGREFYYDRRYVETGLLHTERMGEPIE